MADFARRQIKPAQSVSEACSAYQKRVAWTGEVRSEKGFFW
jgi:hypothetical protein